METHDLLYIESNDFTLYIKGIPYDRKYNSLTQYRSRACLEKETMTMKVEGDGLCVAEVLNINTGNLEPVQSQTFAPIFFENGVYQLVISSKEDNEITFYHEHPGVREAVSPFGKTKILMGNLQFINEVGFTRFSLYSGRKKLVEVTLEIFPSKLNYKEDYRKLLEEVNDEVYNLAFHFIKKTYLGATTILSENPSQTEFFRLLEHFFTTFIKAIQRIEEQPHHHLLTEYQMVRGDRLKHVNRRGIQYLRKHIHLFEQTPNGISMSGNTYMPKKGLNSKKLLSFDTLENRFVKWMMERLVHKLNDLHKRVVEYHENGRFQVEVDKVLVNRVEAMKKQLTQILKKPFWQMMSPLDRTVINLVMQMKIGYRAAFKIYLVVSRGLTLQGEMFKMSVKDVATLYEYWTYLKVGKILRKNYELETQNIVKTKQGVLYVDLDQSTKAKQVFRHPQTGERIVLSFQKNSGRLPTVTQKPDMMLEIQKKGLDYTYNYIFDAKYRIDFASENTYSGSAYPNPGPLEDDINTMHRYRDAHVVRKQQGPYERHAFGAYVLFPWHDEDNYESHRFYKSIDEVNIGGLPFLPNATKLVERFIERLVESNPEDLQNEGILPTGSISFWESNLNERVLVGSVNNKDQYIECKRNGQYLIRSSLLKPGWQKSKFIALYVTQDVTKQINAENGIQFYGEINDVKVIEKPEGLFTQFHLDHWQSLPNVISPVGYGIRTYLETTINMLKEAKDLPELYMKSGEEIKLWRMLKRLTSNVKTELDEKYLDHARKVQAYQIGYYFVNIDFDLGEIHVVHHEEILHRIPIDTLYKQPSHVFKVIKETVFI